MTLYCKREKLTILKMTQARMTVYVKLTLSQQNNKEPADCLSLEKN